MAVLDTIHILMCVLTVNHVSPILSVTLVQLTVPMTVCLTQCIHKNGACRCVPSFEDNNSISESRQSHHSNNGFGGSNEPDLNVDGINDEEQRQSNCGGFSMTHILGSCIIAIALLLGMFPSIGNIIQGSSSSTNDEIIVEKLQLAWSTVIFASSSIPAAGSILYKEHVLSTHKQPVDSNYLNFVLSSCQFIFLGIVFPLFYVLQGFGVTLAGEDSWMNLYPSTDVSDNFSDGLICFLGILSPTTANTRYSEPAVCGYEWIWIFVHVLSIMAVGMAVDKIVHAGATKILYRGISAGLLMAVIVMYFYTTLFTSYTYGPIQKGFDWLSTLLLLVGLEIYHRVALPEVTFETVYPHMDQIYED